MIDPVHDGVSSVVLLVVVSGRVVEVLVYIPMTVWGVEVIECVIASSEDVGNEGDSVGEVVVF